MVEDNIRKFDYAAVDILRNLYKTHPTPIHGKELAGLTHSLEVIWDAYQDSENPEEEVFDFVAVTDDTLDWLEAEGFVRFERMQGHIHPVNVQLTAAGFATIRKISPSKKRWQFWRREESFSNYVDRLFKSQDSKGISNLLSSALEIGKAMMMASG